LKVPADGAQLFDAAHRPAADDTLRNYSTTYSQCLQSTLYCTMS